MELNCNLNRHGTFSSQSVLVPRPSKLGELQSPTKHYVHGTWVAFYAEELEHQENDGTKSTLLNYFLYRPIDT